MRGFQQSYISDESSAGLEDSLYPPDGRKLKQDDFNYLQQSSKTPRSSNDIIFQSMIDNSNSRTMKKDQQNYKDFCEVIEEDDQHNRYQFKKSHVEVLQSGNGHVPSPLVHKDESSFFKSKADESNNYDEYEVDSQSNQQEISAITQMKESEAGCFQPGPIQVNVKSQRGPVQYLRTEACQPKVDADFFNFDDSNENQMSDADEMDNSSLDLNRLDTAPVQHLLVLDNDSKVQNAHRQINVLQAAVQRDFEADCKDSIDVNQIVNQQNARNSNEEQKNVSSKQKNINILQQRGSSSEEKIHPKKKYLFKNLNQPNNDSVNTASISPTKIQKVKLKVSNRYSSSNFDSVQNQNSNKKFNNEQEIEEKDEEEREERLAIKLDTHDRKKLFRFTIHKTKHDQNSDQQPVVDKNLNASNNYGNYQAIPSRNQDKGRGDGLNISRSAYSRGASKSISKRGTSRKAASRYEQKTDDSGDEKDSIDKMSNMNLNNELDYILYDNNSQQSLEKMNKQKESGSFNIHSNSIHSQPIHIKNIASMRQLDAPNQNAEGNYNLIQRSEPQFKLAQSRSNEDLIRKVASDEEEDADDKLSISQISRLHSKKNSRFGIKRTSSILIQDTDDANALQAWPKAMKLSFKGASGILLGQSHQSNQFTENLSNLKKSSVDSAKSGPAFLPLEEIKERVPGFKQIKKTQKGSAKSKSPKMILRASNKNQNRQKTPTRKKNVAIKSQMVHKKDMERNSKSPENQGQANLVGSTAKRDAMSVIYLSSNCATAPNTKVSRNKINKHQQKSSSKSRKEQGNPYSMLEVGSSIQQKVPLNNDLLTMQIPANDKDFQINLTNKIREINPKNLYMQSKKNSNDSLKNEETANLMKLKSSNLVQTQCRIVAQANASGSLISLGSQGSHGSLSKDFSRSKDTHEIWKQLNNIQEKFVSQLESQQQSHQTYTERPLSREQINQTIQKKKSQPVTGSKPKKSMVTSKIPKFMSNLMNSTQKKCQNEGEQKLSKNTVKSAKNSTYQSSNNFVFHQPILTCQKSQKQNSQSNFSTIQNINNQYTKLYNQQNSQKQISLGPMDVKTATQNAIKTFATLTGSLTQSLSNAGTVGSNGTIGGKTTNGGQTKSNSTNSGNKTSSQQQIQGMSSKEQNIEKCQESYQTKGSVVITLGRSKSPKLEKTLLNPSQSNKDLAKSQANKKNYPTSHQKYLGSQMTIPKSSQKQKAVPTLKKTHGSISHLSNKTNQSQMTKSSQPSPAQKGLSAQETPIKTYQIETSNQQMHGNPTVKKTGSPLSFNPKTQHTQQQPSISQMSQQSSTHKKGLTSPSQHGAISSFSTYSKQAASNPIGPQIPPSSGTNMHRFPNTNSCQKSGGKNRAAKEGSACPQQAAPVGMTEKHRAQTQLLFGHLQQTRNRVQYMTAQNSNQNQNNILKSSTSHTNLQSKRMSQGDTIGGQQKSLKSGKSGNLRKDANQERYEADSRNFEVNDSRSHRSNNSKEGMLQAKVSHTRQQAQTPYSNQMQIARSTSPASSNDFGDLNDREELQPARIAQNEEQRKLGLILQQTKEAQKRQIKTTKLECTKKILLKNQEQIFHKLNQQQIIKPSQIRFAKHSSNTHNQNEP